MHLSRSGFLQICFAAAIVALLCSLSVAEAKPLSLSRGQVKRSSSFDSGQQPTTQKLFQTFSASTSDDEEPHQDPATSLHEPCELLVSELKTASADFALYMRMNCPDVSAQSTEHNMPEHCQQSVHEAYELFDIYDTLLQEYCYQQYLALFTTTRSNGDNDRKLNDHNMDDLTSEPNAIIL